MSKLRLKPLKRYLFVSILIFTALFLFKPPARAIDLEGAFQKLKDIFLGQDYVQQLESGEFLLEGKHSSFEAYFGDRALGGKHRVKLLKDSLSLDFAFLETKSESSGSAVIPQTLGKMATDSALLDKEGLTEEQKAALEELESQLSDIEQSQASLEAKMEEARKEVASVDEAVRQVIPGTDLAYDELGKNQLVVKNAQVEPGMDIYYWKRENDLREKIIFREPPAPSRLIFSFNTQGLTPFDVGAGVIYFKNQDGQPVFRITKGYVKDLAGAFSNEVNTVVENNQLVHLLDPNWLSLPERVYPLTLYFDIQLLPSERSL